MTKEGEPITGTCEYDVDSSDATAAVAEILQGKTAYVRGQKLTGTMKNNGAVTGTISSKDVYYRVKRCIKRCRNVVYFLNIPILLIKEWLKIKVSCFHRKNRLNSTKKLPSEVPAAPGRGV